MAGDRYTTIPFYDQYPNRGFGEFGLNDEALAGSANFTNQSTLPNNGLLSFKRLAEAISLMQKIR